MEGYLVTGNKADCSGCEACAQACPVSAINMVKDEEGFSYPVIDENKCIHCDKCKKVCPIANNVQKNNKEPYVWGGYHKDIKVREQSTSGGAFTAIAQEWFSKEDAVVIGAELVAPTDIRHTAVHSLDELNRLRKSKYLQSKIGDSYQLVKQYLSEEKRVLFSGTPCQMAGLKSYLGQLWDSPLLLAVEVMCEGVPSPLYTEMFIADLEQKKKDKVVELDWRYKYKRRWDFEFMQAKFSKGKTYKVARWFNPFWSIWLNHLMSRPSCYQCRYTTKERVADITIADLWGVHIYCPELYAKNTGCSLVICNSKKGNEFWQSASGHMHGHELKFEDALRFQGPMRKRIPMNENREDFMKDLQELNYKQICKKWAKKPTLKLLLSKYVWGNRQKVFVWNLKNKFRKGDK